MKTPAQVTLIQRNRAVQINGFRCSVLSSLSTHYCGWLSYTQALPLGYVSVPQKLTGQECAEIVAKKAWTMRDRVTRTVKVPGLNQYQIQALGEEKFDKGVLTCQGQDARINGKFMKDIIAEREVQLLVEEEEFAAVGKEVEALTSRTKLACLASKGACAGEKTTFVWPPPRKECMLRRVSNLQGHYEGEGQLYAATSILGYFNVSRKPVQGHKALFMHLGTRVLLATATEVPCDQAWPVRYKCRWDMVQIDPGLGQYTPTSRCRMGGAEGSPPPARAEAQRVHER